MSNEKPEVNDEPDISTQDKFIAALPAEITTELENMVKRRVLPMDMLQDGLYKWFEKLNAKDDPAFDIDKTPFQEKCHAALINLKHDIDVSKPHLRRDVVLALLANEKVGTTESENVHLAKEFAQTVLLYHPEDSAHAFINYEIREHFGIPTKEACKNIYECYLRMHTERLEEDARIEEEQKPKKPPAPCFDEVADELMAKHNLIAYDDTREILTYTNGTYRTTSAENQVKKAARETYIEMFVNRCEEASYPIPRHITEPGSGFTSEVLEKIKIDRAIARSTINEVEANQKYLINLKNGIFNLITGELEPHNPEMLTLRQIPVNYNPEADCPNLRKFLKEVVSLSDAQIILEFLGYCLIPDTRYEQSMMFHGSGSNGKSVLLKAMKEFFGSDNIAATSLQRMFDDKFAAAELYGKLVNIYPDLSAKMIDDDDLFKALVSGDNITAQKKFKNSFQFSSFARLIFSANKIPPAHREKYAYYRRWILIEFCQTFVNDPDLTAGEKQKDPNLVSKITTEEEFSGFLNLILAALYNLMKNKRYSNVPEPKNVETLYTVKSDSIRAFTDDCVVYSNLDISISKTEMYSEYKAWCKLKGVKAETQGAFNKRMKGLDFIESRTRDDSGSQPRVWESVYLIYKPSEVLVQKDKPGYEDIWGATEIVPQVEFDESKSYLEMDLNQLAQLRRDALPDAKEFFGNVKPITLIKDLPKVVLEDKPKNEPEDSGSQSSEQESNCSE